MRIRIKVPGHSHIKGPRRRGGQILRKKENHLFCEKTKKKYNSDPE